MLGLHSQDKDSESRAQKKQARLIFYAEAHPILSKDTESRPQRQAATEVFQTNCSDLSTPIFLTEKGNGTHHHGESHKISQE